jgi:hypothetical protein
MKKILFFILMIFPQCVFAEDLFVISWEQKHPENGFIFFDSNQKIKYLHFAAYVIASELERKYYEPPSTNFRISTIHEKKYYFEYENYRPGEQSWMKQISKDKGLTFYRDQEEDGSGVKIMIQQMKSKGRDGKTERTYGIGVRWTY